MLDSLLDGVSRLQSRTSVTSKVRTEDCKYCQGTGRTGFLTQSKGLGLATAPCVYCTRDHPPPQLDPKTPVTPHAKATNRGGFAPPTAAPPAPERLPPGSHIPPSVGRNQTVSSYDTSSYASSGFVPMPRANLDPGLADDAIESTLRSVNSQEQDVHPAYRQSAVVQQQIPLGADPTYEGQYLDGFFHGHGSQRWGDGQQYEGDYVRGKKHGTGRFVWANGSCYTGDFYEEMMTGVGVVKWIDGCEYQGQWRANVMDGRGRFRWPDGRVYEGEYCNDVKEGRGTFTWPDGRLFEGEWRGGQMHGAGTYRNADGKKRNGIWDAGKVVRWL